MLHSTERPDWRALFSESGHTEDAKWRLVAAVRAALADGEPKSTTQLLSDLWGGEVPRDQAARRMSNFLVYLASHALADCARRLPPRQMRRRIPGTDRFYMRTERPWLWKLYGEPGAETARKCPHCGGLL